MPEVVLFAHFAIISSYASKAAWGMRRVAIAEIDREKVKYKKAQYDYDVPQLRIDVRCKGVKRLIYVGRVHYCNNRKGRFAYKDDYIRQYAWVEAFEKLWPCHFLSRHWPRELLK